MEGREPITMRDVYKRQIQIGVLLLLAIAVVALTIVNVMGMRESIHASTERYVEDVARQLALDLSLIHI